MIYLISYDLISISWVLIGFLIFWINIILNIQIHGTKSVPLRVRRDNGTQSKKTGRTYYSVYSLQCNYLSRVSANVTTEHAERPTADDLLRSKTNIIRLFAHKSS